MNHDELYTEGNCKLIGDWLGFAYYETSEGRARWRFQWEIYCGAELFEFLFRGESSSELIREALAREEIYVFITGPTNNHEGFLSFRQLTKPDEDGDIWRFKGRVTFSFKTDPTARHALFAATVEYLKGKSDEKN